MKQIPKTALKSVNRKIAVVASGWHFPAQFYESMSKQLTPNGWTIDLFCVAHRNPSDAAAEKTEDIFTDDQRGKLDKILYSGIPSVAEIEALGWDYVEKDNTVGDWGNTNQWLEEHNYRDYDLFLFTHDDNLIIHDRLIQDTVEDTDFDKWDILTNSIGMPHGSIRGSFEFFKPHVLDLMEDNKFDLSTVTLDRTGETEGTNELDELNNWNNITTPLHALIKANDLQVHTLSPCYRVSAYCIEGERGYISKTHGANTRFEEAGLKYLKDNGII